MKSREGSHEVKWCWCWLLSKVLSRFDLVCEMLLDILCWYATVVGTLWDRYYYVINFRPISNPLPVITFTLIVFVTITYSVIIWKPPPSPSWLRDMWTIPYLFWTDIHLIDGDFCRRMYCKQCMRIKWGAAHCSQV